MADESLVQARMRQFTRVTCGSTVPPAVIAGTTALSGIAGLYAVTGAFDATLASHAGVDPWVTLVPGFVGAATGYTLTVYGLGQFGQGTATGGLTNPPALWVPLPIIQLTLTNGYDPTGATATGVIEANDRLSSAIAVVTGAAASAYELHTTASVGAAFIRVKAGGFPYLLFTSSESSGSAFVFASGGSP